MLDGEAAGGVSRGGRICVAPPLDRLLLVLFLAKQEKYITHVIDLSKVIPFCNLHKSALFLFLSERADFFYILCYTEENIGRRRPYEYCRRKNPPGWRYRG